MYAGPALTPHALPITFSALPSIEAPVKASAMPAALTTAATASYPDAAAVSTAPDLPPAPAPAPAPAAGAPPSGGPATESSSAQVSQPSAPPDPRAALQELILDYEQQAAGLNAKLVRSIESVAEVEDDLAEVRGKLKHNNQQIVDLEKEKEEHLAALNTGVLVEKSLVSSEMQKLMDRVLEETQQRGKAESDKNKIEAELDELSAKLFSDANRLVAAERLARSLAENKSEQLEQSLKNTEAIMAEQQKVLADLQQQLEELRDNPDLELEPLNEPEPVPENGTMVPADVADSSGLPHPLLLRHVRLDVEAFREFKAFIAFLRRQRLELQPYYDYKPYRPAPSVSTNFSRPGMMGPMLTGGHINPFIEAGVGRHKLYPSLPANADALVVVSNQLSQPFLKRMDEEDSAPCLRLDLAPGLGWLNRRTAHTAIIDGTLVIEPVFPDGETPDPDEVRARTSHLAPAECAMCGMAIVNVPLGGLEPSFTTPRGRKTSSGWTSSFSGSANSLLSSAGIRNPKPVHATVQDDDLGDSTASASSSPPPPTSAPLPDTLSMPSASLAPAHTRTEPDQGIKTPTTPTSATATTRRILGNFRFGTSSPTPTRTHTPTSSGLNLPRLGGNKSPAQVPTEEVAATSYHFPLPIPTHVFRLSEESPTRYLLCPHHALRLRAVCSFWEFVRTLEREIVLEGKKPWEADQPQPQITETESKETSMVEQSTDPAVNDEAVDTPTKQDELPVSDEKDASQPVVVANAPLNEETAGQAPQSTSATGETSVGKAVSVDPTSAPSPGPIGEETAGTQEELCAPPSDSASASQDGDQDKAKQPPQLPPRRPARRHPVQLQSGSSTPSESEARSADTADAADAADAAAAADAEAGNGRGDTVVRRETILVSGGENYTWEERVWQQVVQHKANMALARLGFRTHPSLLVGESSRSD